jgi:serine/threonine protein kinase
MSEQKSSSLLRVGNYEIKRKLGSGSFAKVYEARHQLQGTTVALKTVNVSTLKDAYMRRNFKREAALLSRLSHPSIAMLFEVMETRNHFIMVLEFGGENLIEFVQSQKRGRVEEIQARAIGRQLVAAVGHMHERGIVHRDLKLENITINRSTMAIKVCDFGLGNMYSPEKLLETRCGSPEYASPELQMGESYGFEVDIWAL